MRIEWDGDVSVPFVYCFDHAAEAFALMMDMENIYTTSWTYAGYTTWSLRSNIPAEQFDTCARRVVEALASVHAPIAKRAD